MSNDINHEEEGGDEEIWLISYSDLMTLLFGFFVLMYVFASAKTGDAEKVKEGLAKSFGGTYVPPHEELADQLKQMAEDETHPIMKEIEVTTPKDGMEITFRSNLLFSSGSSELLPNVKNTMRMVANLISNNIEDAEIFVGGHTDDVPISTARFPSNWELSSARASSVVREFISTGYDPKMLVAVGYADTRPEYPNLDEKGHPIVENRTKNRRVVIKVVSPGISQQPTPSSIGRKEERRTVLTGNGAAQPKDSGVQQPANAPQVKPVQQVPPAADTVNQ